VTSGVLTAKLFENICVIFKSRQSALALKATISMARIHSSQLNPGSGLRFVILLIHVEKYNQWLLRPSGIPKIENVQVLPEPAFRIATTI